MFQTKWNKKLCIVLLMLPLLLCAMTGCSSIGQKTASTSMIYAVTSGLSLLLLICYCGLVRRKDGWFLLLFGSVLIVNIGYYSLSVSAGLEEALLANRISYFGSVLLPMSMLMIILEAVKLRYPKWVVWGLLGLAVLVFLIAASPGYSDIYYREVTYVRVNGAATLQKVYGILHSVYLFYLAGYFAVMLAVIVSARRKGRLDSGLYCVILLTAVFVNICVWLLEQMVRIEFEFLSVSYIISELFLLGGYMLMRENQRLQAVIAAGERNPSTQQPAPAHSGGESAEPPAEPNSAAAEDDFDYDQYLAGLDRLTQTERAVYDLYVDGRSTKEIMQLLNIKENTLKFHNKNLYGKLGVSSRKQLLAVYRKLKARNLI